MDGARAPAAAAAAGDAAERLGARFAHRAERWTARPKAGKRCGVEEEEEEAEAEEDVSRES